MDGSIKIVLGVFIFSLLLLNWIYYWWCQ